MESAAELNYRKGMALHGAGDFAGALAAFDAALSAAPEQAVLHYGRANALVMLHRMDQAIGAYDRCLALDPGQAAALYNKAMVLIQLQRWHDALAVLDELVGKKPGIADAWNNRSGVLQALGRNEEAFESIQQVLKLRAPDARALYNAGILLLTLKRFDEAQRFLADALRAAPGSGEILGSLGSAALHACDWESLEPLIPTLFSAVRNGTAALAPLTMLALSDDPLLQKRCAELNLQRSLAGTEPGAPAMASRAYGHDRIRIGYLSSDFGDHPVSAQIVGLLEKHDRTRFEVVGLFTGRKDDSARYHRIVKACDRFHDIGGLGSREAAAMIRDAEIDILVDLNGPTMGWRPAILKYRPAPVIASYLGYAGTTGADFVDYIIGDPQVTPFAMAPVLAEKIVQLPHCFWPSDPGMPEPQVLSRPDVGLPPDEFVFCCFNATHKIRPQIFDIWARLLQAVPASLLWLRDSHPAVNERFRRQLQTRGVDPARLLFAGRMDSFAAHLGRQALADLFLDTFPYNAHATASDALWAGLPVVTLRGESFVSRVSSSLLTNIGLQELIAATPQEYESIALSLARNREGLAELRRKLTSGRRTAVLFDMDRFVRDIEAAYLQMLA